MIRILTCQLCQCEAYEVPIPNNPYPQHAHGWQTSRFTYHPYQPARSSWSAGELYGPSRPSTMMSFTRFTGFYHQQFHCAVLNNINTSWNGSRLVSGTRPFLCVIKIGLECRPSRPCFTFCPPPTLLGWKSFSGLGAATTGWWRDYLYFWCWLRTSEAQEGGKKNDVLSRDRSSNTGHSRSIKNHPLAGRTTTLVSMRVVRFVPLVRSSRGSI